MSSAEPAPLPPLPPRCAEVSQGASFVIGKPSTQPDPDQQVIDLPFAVEIGGAHSFDAGYLVTALRSVGKETHAMLASVSADAAAGRAIELGRVHGDVEPPVIATRKDRVVVGVADHDASGSIVRLATISQAATNPNVTWGALPPIGNDESQAFDIALGDSRGVLVWDDFKKADGYGSVWSLSFNLDDPSSITPARVVSLKGQDVESPQLAERPGGFWLAWVAHSKLDNPRPAASAKAPPEELESEILVDLGKRWLEVVRLDENGVRRGEPMHIGSKDAHVLVFDLAAGPDGSAWLAWRDDATSPGAERGTVLLASLSASGSITELKLEDERVGAGVPRLVGVEGADKQAAWLALGTVGDRTTFVALSKDFKLLEALDNDPLVGSADMLAAHADRVLLSKPSGLAAELSVARCVHREAAGAAADANAAVSGQPEVTPPPNEEAAGDSPVAAPDPS